MSAPEVIKNQDYYNFTVSILIIVKRKCSNSAHETLATSKWVVRLSIRTNQSD